jgi:hypothetical protein
MKTTEESAQRTFTALKPTALDELTADAHTRRRTYDLEQATATTPESSRRRPPAATPGRVWRRPLLVAGGLATAAAVAAAAIIVTDGGSTPKPGRTEVGTADARSLLLAAAASAEKAPVSGRYWYTRERTTTLVSGTLSKRGGKVQKGGPIPKLTPFGFTISSSSTEDTWYPRDRHDPSRTVVNIDPKVGLAGAADQAKWRKLGSPNLVHLLSGVSTLPKTKVNNYPGLSNAEIRQAFKNDSASRAPQDLPTDRAALEALLHKEWAAQTKAGDTADSFPNSVFGLAQDLLAGPLKPGTRGALYRILADLNGLKLVGKVTDPQGRPGVAVDQSVNGTVIRLIVDKSTGRLLAQESWGTGQARIGRPGLTLMYQSMGWVNALGARP